MSFKDLARLNLRLVPNLGTGNKPACDQILTASDIRHCRWRNEARMERAELLPNGNRAGQSAEMSWSMKTAVLRHVRRMQLNLKSLQYVKAELSMPSPLDIERRSSECRH
jgi:hypothetical protein